MKKAIATALLALVPLAAFAEDGIRFDTIVLEAGKPIATPSVWVSFGEEAVIEVTGKVRIVATAASPKGDRSDVTALMYYFADGAWVLDETAQMNANIAETPSFEQDLGNKLHRVVVMPRAASKPTSGGI